MAARKTPSFGNKNKVAAEPIEFNLLDETIVAYGEVPGIVLLNFVAKSGKDFSTSSEAILEYLEASMDEENLEKFNRIVNDPENIIELEVLSDIVGYLIETRTERSTSTS